MYFKKCVKLSDCYRIENQNQSSNIFRIIVVVIYSFLLIDCKNYLMQFDQPQPFLSHIVNSLDEKVWEGEYLIENGEISESSESDIIKIEISGKESRVDIFIYRAFKKSIIDDSLNASGYIYDEKIIENGKNIQLYNNTIDKNKEFFLVDYNLEKFYVDTIYGFHYGINLAESKVVFDAEGIEYESKCIVKRVNEVLFISTSSELFGNQRGWATVAISKNGDNLNLRLPVIVKNDINEILDITPNISHHKYGNNKYNEYLFNPTKDEFFKLINTPSQNTNFELIRLKRTKLISRVVLIISIFPSSLVLILLTSFYLKKNKENSITFDRSNIKGIVINSLQRAKIEKAIDTILEYPNFINATEIDKKKILLAKHNYRSAVEKRNLNLLTLEEFSKEESKIVKFILEWLEEK